MSSLTSCSVCCERVRLENVLGECREELLLRLRASLLADESGDVFE